MNGRVYVQMKDRAGWIHSPYRLVKKLSPSGRPLPIKIPENAEDIVLTSDITMSWKFDVDSPKGYDLLKDIVNKGGIAAIARNYLIKETT